MAKGHTCFWRRPGRRNEERKRFGALMRKVEAVRICYGMTKVELATEPGANAGCLRAWMTGARMDGKRPSSTLNDSLREEETKAGGYPILFEFALAVLGRC
jgi:hypothetical protein